MAIRNGVRLTFGHRFRQAKVGKVVSKIDVQLDVQLLASDSLKDNLVQGHMDYTVIIATPYWELSGVNSVALNLVRGLTAQGIEARIVITQDPIACKGNNPMPLPPNLAVDYLPIETCQTWPQRWRVMIDYLEQRTPCVYIPNYDWSFSAMIPRLSRQVGVVGVVHSDDPKYYEFVERMGAHLNAIVTVSELLAQQVVQQFPHVKPRLRAIANGVAVAPQFPERQVSDPQSNPQNNPQPLQIIYAGRLMQEQKRVLDLPKIMAGLKTQGIPAQLTLVGDGRDRQELQQRCEELEVEGMVTFLGTLPHATVMELYGQQDVFLLCSEFEGMPMSLLEAMGRGCLPVVSDIASGIPQLVQSGVNGYRVAVGDINEFVAVLAKLQADLASRRQMAQAAYRTVGKKGYRLEDMTHQYQQVFEAVFQAVAQGQFRRPHRRILPPSYLQKPWKERLPEPIRDVGRLGKRCLRALKLVP